MQSVMLQDYHNLEHIVVDDGSTDSTPTILEKYETKYNLRWISKKNEGQAIAVNTGFDLATGEVVVWLNSDDVLFTRNVISRIVKAFKRSDSDVVYGHMAIIDENNLLRKIQFSPSNLSHRILSIGHYAACISYRRAIALDYKLDPTLDYALDYDQSLRMARDHVKFVFLDRVILGWRRHSAAKSVTGSSRMKEEAESIRKRHQAPSRCPSSLLKLPIYGELMIRKLLGIRLMMRIESEGEIAFPIKFDSKMRSLLANVIPYT